MGMYYVMSYVLIDLCNSLICILVYNTGVKSSGFIQCVRVSQCSANKHSVVSKVLLTISHIKVTSYQSYLLSKIWYKNDAKYIV